MPYISSIISKYGDTDNVARDSQVLFEILGRQGSRLLIDVIAESAGSTSNKFSLTANERYNLIEKLVSELHNALDERL